MIFLSFKFSQMRPKGGFISVPRVLSQAGTDPRESASADWFAEAGT